MVSLTIQELKTLKSEKEIQLYFNEISEAEIQVDFQLDQMLSQQNTVAEEIARLDQLAPRFGKLLLNVQDIARTVSQTNELAVSTSAKVRQLDLEQSRVSETLKVFLVEKRKEKKRKANFFESY